jgi:hypothetical protein
MEPYFAPLVRPAILIIANTATECRCEFKTVWGDRALDLGQVTAKCFKLWRLINRACNRIAGKSSRPRIFRHDQHQATEKLPVLAVLPDFT